MLYSKAVDPTTATTTSNYAIDNGVSVTGASLAGDGKTVTLTTSTLTAPTLYTLTVNNVQDTEVPPHTIAANSTKTFTTTAVPPTIISATCTSRTSVQVVYSKTVDPTTATTITNYAIDNGVSVTNASIAGDGKTVTLTTSTMTGPTLHTLTVNNVQDLESPPYTISANSTKQFTPPVPPEISSAGTLSSTQVQVVFSKQVTGGTANAASNYGIAGISISGASLGGDGKTVTLTVSTLSAGTTYTVTVNNIQDLESPAYTIAPNSQKSFFVPFPGVFTENTGHAVPSRFVAGTNLAPYGWWAPSGVSIHYWEEYRKFYTSTGTNQLITVTNSLTDKTMATVHGVTGGTPGYNCGGLWIGPDGYTTPANALLSVNQLRDQATGSPQAMNLRVGFAETSSPSDVGRWLDSGSMNGDGYPGHYSEIDPYWRPTYVDMQYIYVNILSDQTVGSDSCGRTATGGAETAGNEWHDPITLTASGSFGPQPWPVTTRIYDAGGGNMTLELKIGGWTGSYLMNLVQTNYGVAFKDGSFDWQHVAPFIFLGKPDAPGTYIPCDQDVYVTTEGVGPSVAITAPASGFICGQGMAAVSLTATTTDGTPNTVTGVEFFDTIASVQTKLGDAAGGGGSWAFSWTTSAATLGTHSITAKATDGGGWTATSAPIIVKVWIPGDATGNGLVDGLDYNAWQNGYQQPNATFATGDYDGNGQVDGLDYNVWQNNYNHTAVYQADEFGPMGAESAAAAAPAPVAAESGPMTQPAAVMIAGGPAAASAPHITAIKRGTRNAELGTQDQQPQNNGPGVMSLTLVFDTAVQAGAGAVEVSGMATGQDRSFTQAYDAATKSLVLTWAQPLAADVYSVRVVADFVVGADGGAPLDGEVGDPAAPTLPSGDGVPGGDAMLEFEVE